ncbi:DNA-binding transcriptional MocR family regulator [Motilibacter peucedani]|uniref:DNA-binding transcriptional MocR family regulator n=1 Tax=Motilibacter peucedani TaxID=598650 RepID=A0A420XNX9_9ACTN|nr:aminotransferase class I/II-fold pyridoxal phosphate-dependent enzyme [Motilibacter peucedani]RKS73910.1 DNA-binding transcriptional MocR family regulator [Motilibacter peucedani]
MTVDVDRIAELLRAPGAAGIAERLEQAVREGSLAAGQQLPPIRTLAGLVGVDANTVAAAYRAARERGLVETAGRAGTRVRARPPVASRGSLGLGALPPGVVDLTQGGPDPALLPPLELPARGTVSEGYPHGRSSRLLTALEQVARRRLDAVGVPADHLVAASGALDGIERVLLAHLRPGDRLAVEDPGWANVLDLAGALGLVAEPLECDDDGPVPGSLAAALATGARGVVVTARAHNPTGAAVSAERAGELRTLLAGRPGTLVVEDDHGADLTALPLATLAGATEHWAHLRSASKAYGPDLRCAVMAADETTAARVEGRFRLGQGWVSLLLQGATAAAWERHADAAHAAGRVYDERREALRSALRERGVASHGRTGLNVWVPVRDEATALAGTLAGGYAVAPGARYRQRSAPAVRITTACLPVERAPDVAAALASALEGSGAYGV